MEDVISENFLKVRVSTVDEFIGEYEEFINDISKNVDFSISETIVLNWSRLFRKLTHHSFTSFSFLTLFFLGYCILSSLIFTLVESNHREKSQEKFRQLRNDFRSQSSKKICGMLNVIVCDEHKLNDVFHKYELFLKNNLDTYVNEMNPWPWNFYNSLGFVFITFTTIGDGKLTPATATGQILCCVTPLLGIPMFLMISVQCSKLIHELLTGIYYKKLRTQARPESATPSINCLMLPKRDFNTPPSHTPGHTKIDTVHNGNATQSVFSKPIESDYIVPAASTSDREIIENEPEEGQTSSPTVNSENSASAAKGKNNPLQRHVAIPVKAALTILYGYVAAGAFILTLQTNWTFVSSFYYIHGMLTTIGYGDLDPWEQVTLLHLLYLFFGFILAALAIEAIQEYLLENHKAVVKKITESLDGFILNEQMVLIPHDLKINR